MKKLKKLNRVEVIKPGMVRQRTTGEDGGRKGKHRKQENKRERKQGGQVGSR